VKKQNDKYSEIKKDMDVKLNAMKTALSTGKKARETN